MDFKEIKNTKHYIYDSIEEFNLNMPNVPVRHNWRHGEEGEWVFTDDGYVCQILRKTEIASPKNKKASCVRTICGTYGTDKMAREMLGEDGIPENIYTFSGKNTAMNNHRSRGNKSKVLLFARYIASGVGAVESYRLAYPGANVDRYIKERTKELLKTERVQKMVKEEIRAILEEEGVTNNWLIERYKVIADLAESDTAKLKSLDSLSKISGLFDTDSTKSEQVTVWTGFSPEQLKEADTHAELIAHAERERKEED